MVLKSFMDKRLSSQGLFVSNCCWNIIKVRMNGLPFTSMYKNTDVNFYFILFMFSNIHNWS